MEYNDKYGSMELSELAAAQLNVKLQLDEAKRVQSELQSEFDYLRKVALPNKMEEMGIDGAKITGVGRISLRQEMYAGINKEHEAEAYAWLESNGHGDLIKDYIHSSTLKAFIKEQIRSGELLPDELFKVDPFTMAVITKS